jgi:hypothetical protein
VPSARRTEQSSQFDAVGANLRKGLIEESFAAWGPLLLSRLACREGNDGNAMRRAPAPTDAHGCRSRLANGGVDELQLSSTHVVQSPMLLTVHWKQPLRCTIAVRPAPAPRAHEAIRPAHPHQGDSKNRSHRVLTGRANRILSQGHQIGGDGDEQDIVGRAGRGAGPARFAGAAVQAAVACSASRSGRCWPVPMT